MPPPTGRRAPGPPRVPVQLLPQPLVLARGHGARPLLLLQGLPLGPQNLLELVQLRLVLQHVAVPAGGDTLLAARSPAFRPHR